MGMGRNKEPKPTMNRQQVGGDEIKKVCIRLVGRTMENDNTDIFFKGLGKYTSGVRQSPFHLGPILQL
jgi:hypothetical protein